MNIQKRGKGKYRCAKEGYCHHSAPFGDALTQDIPDSNISLRLPSWYISRTMSLPPISSPWTNTCGIVGNSDHSFRAVLALGSDKTFTHANCSSPTSLAKELTIWAPLFENPHCGCAGVPFMKITSGLLSTTSCNSSEVQLNSLMYSRPILSPNVHSKELLLSRMWVKSGAS